MWVGGQRHAPAGLFPGTHCVGGRVGPKNVLTCAVNLALTWIRSPDLPVRRESLYRVSCPRPLICYSLNIIIWSFQIRFASIYSSVASENKVSFKQITQYHCHWMSPFTHKHRNSNVTSLTGWGTVSFSRWTLLYWVCSVC